MPELSWLSPRRRRTTGNLKTISNGAAHDSEGAENASTEPAAPVTPTRSSSSTVSPRSDRRATVPRPVSQPNASSMSPSPSNNLFYAYARKGDDARFRYLLTFASAATATEWWLLVQRHFPDASRPGPQLFSFKTEELLSRAWKHEALAHLKTKWMYISFSDSSSNGFGGAAQGIIPVQDADGNMLGGSAPASPGQLTEVRKEARGVRNELSRLEEHFEKMMEAVERNTDSVKKLAQEREAHNDAEQVEAGPVREGYFDASEISSHFGRVTDILQRNSEHIENLSKRQFENEQKLRDILDDVSGKQRADYLDMSQLSSHLDRIQSMMESSVQARPDSAKGLANGALPPIDFSPLTSRLESVQGAVERNSDWIKSLLGGVDAAGHPPFELVAAGNKEAQRMDVTPLVDQLRRVQEAIQQQSTDLLSSQGATDTRHSELAERLDSVAKAIEEASKAASGRETSQPNLSPFDSHLQSIKESSSKHADILQKLLDSHTTLCASLDKSKAPDFQPLTKHLDTLQTSTKNNSSILEKMLAEHKTLRTTLEKNKPQPVDFSSVTKHLDAISSSSKSANNATQQSLKAQQAMQNVVESFRGHLPQIDSRAITKSLDAISSSSKDSASILQKVLKSQDAAKLAIEKSKGGELSFRPLTDALQGLQTTSQQQSQHLERLIEVHAETKDAIISSARPEVDLNSLEQHVEDIHTTIADHAKYLAEIVQTQKAVPEAMEQAARALDLAPLADRLEAIQLLLKDNAAIDTPDLSPLSKHLEALREDSSSHLNVLEHILTAQNKTKEALDDRRADADLQSLTSEVQAVRGIVDSIDHSESLSRLIEHLQAIRSATEKNSTQMGSLASEIQNQQNTHTDVDLSPLTTHLEAIRMATEHNAEQMRELATAHASQHHAFTNVLKDNNSAMSSGVDFSPLTDRLSSIQSSLERANSFRDEDQTGGTGDAKFLLSALSSHLSKIQGLTEQNATAYKRAATAQTRLAASVAETSEHVRVSAKAKTDSDARQAKIEARLDATSSQVRELMAGQREMVNVVRELAQAITAQNKGACDHVVVPPPRKVGRKIVGFVYDVKDGPVER